MSLRSRKTKEQRFAESQYQGVQADKRTVEAKLKKIDNDSKETCLEFYPWNSYRGKKVTKVEGLHGKGFEMGVSSCSRE